MKSNQTARWSLHLHTLIALSSASVTNAERISACNEEKVPVQQICLSLITQDPGHCKVLVMHHRQCTEELHRLEWLWEQTVTHYRKTQKDCKMLMLAIITQAHSYPNAKRPLSLPALSPTKHSHSCTFKTYSWLPVLAIMERRHRNNTFRSLLLLQWLLNKPANYEWCSEEWENVGINKNGRGKKKKTSSVP